MYMAVFILCSHIYQSSVTAPAVTADWYMCTSGYSVRSGCGKPGFDPRPRHTKDVKTGRFALLSLALGIKELGNRLGGSDSVQMV